MCERPGIGIASSGTADSRITASVARTATRIATTTGRPLGAPPAATQLASHVARGTQGLASFARVRVGGHDAIPSAISLAAATDRSRFRYRVSALRLSSSAGKSPTPKSGSWAGSPHTWAPSRR